jgi:hypothetical protein
MKVGPDMCNRTQMSGGSKQLTHMLMLPIPEPTAAAAVNWWNRTLAVSNLGPPVLLPAAGLSTPAALSAAVLMT